MRKIDFFIVGAARTATTSMHYALARHPSISMSSVKEPNFYAFRNGRPSFAWVLPEAVESEMIANSTTSAAEYSALFPSSSADVIVGEASPTYLHSMGAAERISLDHPNAKIVVGIRQPIERAFSHYLQICAGESGFSPTFGAFREAIEDELLRGRALITRHNRVPLAEGSRYAEYVRKYTQIFGRDNILVVEYGQFKVNPTATYRAIAEHVGVSDNNIKWLNSAVVTAYNASNSGGTRPTIGQLIPSLAPHGRRLARAVLPRRMYSLLAVARHNLAGRSRRTPTNLPPAEVHELTSKHFGDDMAALERLIGVDLSGWLG